MKKITLTFRDEDYEALKVIAKADGFDRVSSFLKNRSLKHTIPIIPSCIKNYELAVDNADELEAYVREKKLTDVSCFARFSMQQYMLRFPLTKGQKARVERIVE